MVLVPAAWPVTVTGLAVLPDNEAIPAALLAHVPPDVDELSDVVRPTHIVGLPVIGFGTGLVLIVAVVLAVMPLASVTVSVYTVTVAVGEATTLTPVLADSVELGDQV